MSDRTRDSSHFPPRQTIFQRISDKGVPMVDAPWILIFDPSDLFSLGKVFRLKLYGEEVGGL